MYVVTVQPICSGLRFLFKKVPQKAALVYANKYCRRKPLESKIFIISPHPIVFPDVRFNL